METRETAGYRNGISVGIAPREPRVTFLPSSVDVRAVNKKQFSIERLKRRYFARFGKHDFANGPRDKLSGRIGNKLQNGQTRVAWRGVAEK